MRIFDVSAATKTPENSLPYVILLRIYISYENEFSGFALVKKDMPLRGEQRRLERDIRGNGTS